MNFLINKGISSKGVVIPHAFRINSKMCITEEDTLDVDGDVYPLNERDLKYIQDTVIEAILSNIAIGKATVYTGDDIAQVTAIIATEMKDIRKYLYTLLGMNPKDLMYAIGNDASVPYLWIELANSYSINVPLLVQDHPALGEISEYLTEHVIGNAVPMLSKEVRDQLKRNFFIRIEKDGAGVLESNRDFKFGKGVSVFRDAKVFGVRIDGIKYYPHEAMWEELISTFTRRYIRRIKKTYSGVNLHEIVVKSRLQRQIGTLELVDIAYENLDVCKGLPIAIVGYATNYGPIKWLDEDNQYMNGFLRGLLH